ncbi:hypothetical protein [Rickettsia endosymbiont of Halotydeus destructor]|uniref:hypothetical protein n=1 Tax=Rickettsia endosymbiont of Halotydeus destructor TaxID=2996754 RepID=UPI003BAEB6F3
MSKGEKEFKEAFDFIKQGKYTHAVSRITEDSANLRADLTFDLNVNGQIIRFQTPNITILEALCYAYSCNYTYNQIAFASNGIFDPLQSPILKNITACINKAVDKMLLWEKTDWQDKDGNGNTTAEWLAWSGTTESLKKLLDNKPELIEIEQKTIRNAFNVTMEVPHLTAGQKEEIYKILTDKKIATPLRAIKSGKLDPAYNVLNEDNVNDGTTEALIINGTQVMSNTNLTPFSAISALYQAVNPKSAVQEYTLKIFEKMKNFSTTNWTLKDSADCTLFQWAVWANSPKLVEDFSNLPNFPELTEIEQKASRNVFDVTMQQPHITEKEAISHVLISKGIFLNNLQTFFDALKNAKLKDIILKEIDENSKEIFSPVADKIITKYGALLSALKNAPSRDDSLLIRYMQEANEVITKIFEQEKIDIESLLQKEITANNGYESTFLHWLLELGNKNLENLIKQYDKGMKLNFYVKDSSNISVAEWLADYKMDCLKYLAAQGYLNPNNKNENLRILDKLVTNSSKANLSKEVAPFFKKLLEHKPPLFDDKLDSVKDTITTKKVSVSDKQELLNDLNLCLGYIDVYESMEVVGEFNLYD